MKIVSYIIKLFFACLKNYLLYIREIAKLYHLCCRCVWNMAMPAKFNKVFIKLIKVLLFKKPTKHYVFMSTFLYYNLQVTSKLSHMGILACSSHFSSYRLYKQVSVLKANLTFLTAFFCLDWF